MRRHRALPIMERCQDSGHHDRFDVNELPYSVHRQLATVTAFLDAAEGQALIGPRERPDLSLFVQRIAELRRAHVFDEPLLEGLPDRIDHDESLSCDAALARIDEPGFRANARGHFDVSILEHKIGIATPELQ